MWVACSFGCVAHSEQAQAALDALPPAGVLSVRGGGAANALAQTGTGARGAASGGIRIVEQEGALIVGAFEVAGGEARFVGELVRSGDDLFLRGSHIEGNATLREVYQAARQFGREQGVKRVIIEGGKRTTGKVPGHIPRPLTIETGL